MKSCGTVAILMCPVSSSSEHGSRRGFGTELLGPLQVLLPEFCQIFWNRIL